MTQTELATALKTTPAQVRRWVTRGLPRHRVGRRVVFDPAKVRRWLIDEGIACENSPPNLVRTKAQVAAHFEVNERSVGYWFARGCPHEPNRYDLDAIAAWREQNAPKTTPESIQRAKLLEIQVEQLQLKLAESRRELLPLDPVLRWSQHLAGEIKSRLEQLPDMLIAALPPKTPRVQLNATRAKLRRVVDDCLTTLADAVLELDPLNLDPDSADHASD